MMTNNQASVYVADATGVKRPFRLLRSGCLGRRGPVDGRRGKKGANKGGVRKVRILGFLFGRRDAGGFEYTN
jgi:hypothetical protein